jgi:sugar phosphate isomerase/epimerase
MAIKTGLNPYGLTYHLGMQGAGTPRANPEPAGLEGFIALGEELGARILEIWQGWLTPLDTAQLAVLRARLERLGMQPVISSRLDAADFPQCLRAAEALGAETIRLSLTAVLCGDRHLLGDKWPDLVDSVRQRLAVNVRLAEAAGRRIVIENHQDFTSRELVGLCKEMGPSVGIVFDTGNTFPVAEAPLAFTETIAPYVRHVHFKDYRVQMTGEGFRLVRCAIGDGAVPLAEMLAILTQHTHELTAVLEPGALEARHVRLFLPQWWQHYEERQATELAACLHASRRHALPEDADYRTPWESGDDDELAEYELRMIRRSAANMRALGLMGED